VCELLHRRATLALTYSDPQAPDPACALMHKPSDDARWRWNMKTLITALTLATLIAAPAFTSTARAANEVFVGDKLIGADPDANVRLQLRRDSGSEGY